MLPDLVDQISFVMLDLATRPAHEVEVIVGVGKFPSCSFIRPQPRLPYQLEIGE